MNAIDIAHQRLANQRLTHTGFKEAFEVVAWLGAVQAQDYSGAKWAIAQRTQGSVDATVERAFNEGALLRTHVLRPTWHFVTPADIRWLLALSGPRVKATNAHYYRKLELDDAVFKRSNAALTKALQGGKQLTRPELTQMLQRARIQPGPPNRVAYLLMHAELIGLICSGARRGKQFTYALLDERVPPAPEMDRDQALCELSRRYFATRGPATVRDFAWWSGLTLADARRGLHAAQAHFEQDSLDGQTYWFAAPAQPGPASLRTAHLLPNYDEYFIGLKDRSAIGQVWKQSGLEARTDALSAHIIIVNGQIVGGWKRKVRNDAVEVHLNILADLTAAEQRAVAAATQKYAAFLGLPLVMV
jgi:hypothetical protein